MVKGELRNIEEVKADEQATGPNLNDFLFDVSLEQVEISPDFDWNTCGCWRNCCRRLWQFPRFLTGSQVFSDSSQFFHLMRYF